ncbi:hypothetical protein C0991_004300, partial [Blastosporella zonata]
MVTQETSEATIAKSRPRRDIRAPARMRDNADQPTPPATTQTKKHNTPVEDSDDSDFDIGQPTIQLDSDEEDDDDLPLPSEIGRTPSQSSMAPSKGGTKDNRGGEGVAADGYDSNESVLGEKDLDDGDFIAKKILPRLKASVYAFFDPKPTIEWHSYQPRKKGGKVVSRRYVKFRCSAPQCKSQGQHSRFVYCATKGSDKTLTRNLRAHAEGCWGKEALQAADRVEGGQAQARDILKGRDNNLRDGSILTAFENKTRVTLTYSTRPPTVAETKANHVRWIAESKRPFEIVRDPGYLLNMKEGHPQQYVPSPSTVRRDVKEAFAGCRRKVAKILQDVEGAMHFGTNCWTSPNHRAFIAVIVQYEEKGKIHSWCLDVVELPKRHTGHRLAEALMSVIEEFGLLDKFLASVSDNASPNNVMVDHFRYFSSCAGAEAGAANR